MDEILDEQLLVHDAAALAGLALLRPAAFEESEPMPVIGAELDRDALLDRLEPALKAAWPDRPQDVTELETFLREAYSRLVSRAHDLATEEGFVPAARWRNQARDLLLEHLRVEVEALIGGVRTEGFWQSFNALSELAPLEELVSSGMLIKLRSVGAFLISPPSRYEDEFTAASFFSAGGWEAGRDDRIAQRVAETQKITHKQIAHLTLSRPLPEEIGAFRPSSYLALVQDVLTLLEGFSEAADPRLLPDWWQDWIGSLRPRLLQD